MTVKLTIVTLEQMSGANSTVGSRVDKKMANDGERSMSYKQVEAASRFTAAVKIDLTSKAISFFVCNLHLFSSVPEERSNTLVWFDWRPDQVWKGCRQLGDSLAMHQGFDREGTLSFSNPTTLWALAKETRSFRQMSSRS